MWLYDNRNGKQLSFVLETKYILYEVGTEFLNIIHVTSMLKALTLMEWLADSKIL
jgi:hypothetical protein